MGRSTRIYRSTRIGRLAMCMVLFGALGCAPPGLRALGDLGHPAVADLLLPDVGPGVTAPGADTAAPRPQPGPAPAVAELRPPARSERRSPRRMDRPPWGSPAEVIGAASTSWVYTGVRDPTQPQADLDLNHKHNARLAAAALHGAVIQPGEALSFNERVAWETVDRGYRTGWGVADDEFAPVWAGGICQAATSLYQAGLRAGLRVIERHRHTIPVPYARDGSDAAVSEDWDLVLANPHPFPVRIETRASRSGLEVRVVRVPM